MRIGIDLGGTKIEGIVLDTAATRRRGCGSTRRRLLRGRVPGDRRGGARAREAGRHDVQRRRRHPGAISPATGLIKNANSTRLNGRPLNKDLERLLDRPVRLENDANCFAVSEASDGAAKGCGIVFGVILGTGVAAAWWSTAVHSPARRRSPANGATIPCPSRATTSGPACAAIAAAWVASRPG
jgi:fructokinase